MLVSTGISFGDSQSLLPFQSPAMKGVGEFASFIPASAFFDGFCRINLSFPGEGKAVIQLCGMGDAIWKGGHCSSQRLTSSLFSSLSFSMPHVSNSTALLSFSGSNTTYFLLQGSYCLTIFVLIIFHQLLNDQTLVIFHLMLLPLLFFLFVGLCFFYFFTCISERFGEGEKVDAYVPSTERKPRGFVPSLVQGLLYFLCQSHKSI